MTRPFALVLAGLALAACDDAASKPAAQKRSEAIAASAKPVASTTDKSVEKSAAKEPRAPRHLCLPPAADGKSLPASGLDHVEAEGAAKVEGRLPTGGGKWTWVNLWAAWCAPCREEIPRLLSFEKKLSSAGVPIRVAFVSLDDDERQAKKFLGEQPATGLRASHWLPDGAARDAFLDAAKLKKEPTLPIQILLDPKGAIRCVIDGAVEESDYPQLETWLKGT